MIIKSVSSNLMTMATYSRYKEFSSKVVWGYEYKTKDILKIKIKAGVEYFLIHEISKIETLVNGIFFILSIPLCLCNKTPTKNLLERLKSSSITVLWSVVNFFRNFSLSGVIITEKVFKKVISSKGFFLFFKDYEEDYENNYLELEPNCFAIKRLKKNYLEKSVWEIREDVEIFKKKELEKKEKNNEDLSDSSSSIIFLKDGKFLPDEVLIEIFKFLPTKDIFSNIQFANKNFKNYVNSDHMGNLLIERDLKNIKKEDISAVDKIDFYKKKHPEFLNYFLKNAKVDISFWGERKIIFSNGEKGNLKKFLREFFQNYYNDYDITTISFRWLRNIVIESDIALNEEESLISLIAKINNFFRDIFSNSEEMIIFQTLIYYGRINKLTFNTLKNFQLK